MAHCASFMLYGSFASASLCGSGSSRFQCTPMDGILTLVPDNDANLLQLRYIYEMNKH